jgi:hypothetical protein
MATLSSEIAKQITSRVNGSSEISIKKVKGSFDVEDFFGCAIFVCVVVSVECHTVS